MVCARVLDAQEKLGGDGLEPFFGLLDGGRNGSLFREMEDYFYYAQIRRFAFSSFLQTVFHFTVHFLFCVSCYIETSNILRH